MDAAEKIRQLMAEGKISEEEGLRLIEAYVTAEARDRVVREELKRMNTRRRGAGAWAAVNLGLLVVALGVLLAGTVIIPSIRQRPADDLDRVAEQLLGQDLDLVIERLEARLRKPGTASDYRLLGMAYEARYERTRAESDRARAAAALARADRLERRMAMRGNSGLFGLVFILVVVTGIALWIMLMYNGLARRDERVDERWAQVEAMLQRRLDLIPGLVEVVRGYAAHERETFLAVTEARARMLGVLGAAEGGAPRSPQTVEELGAAQAQLSGALGRLLAIVESYPDLKASTNFVTLQDQLEGTENRIAVERQRYNDAVRLYNARLRTFPSNVVGGMFGYEQREYYESKLGAEEPVDINL